MHRVLIIGHPGAGKSTLAAKLGEILRLPVIHLDRHFWNSGWITTDKQPWRETVRELISAEQWIIEGHYGSTLDIRLPRADTVVFLDFKTPICLWRVLKRIVTSYGQVRSDMADGCPEHIDWVFFKWVWNFRRDVRPESLNCLREHFANGRLITLTNPRQVRSFLSEIE